MSLGDWIPWVGCHWDVLSLEDKIKCLRGKHDFKEYTAIEGWCELYAWRTCERCGYTINDKGPVYSPSPNHSNPYG